jgi:hypothetical protein
VNSKYNLKEIWKFISRLIINRFINSLNINTNHNKQPSGKNKNGLIKKEVYYELFWII